MSEYVEEMALQNQRGRNRTIERGAGQEVDRCRHTASRTSHPGTRWQVATSLQRSQIESTACFDTKLSGKRETPKRTPGVGAAHRYVIQTVVLKGRPSTVSGFGVSGDPKIALFVELQVVWAGPPC